MPTIYEPHPSVADIPIGEISGPCSQPAIGAQLDLLNVPIADAVGPDFVGYYFQQSPNSPCETVIDDDGNTEPVWHSSYRYGTLLKTTHKLKRPLSKLVGTAGNPATVLCNQGWYCWHLMYLSPNPGRYYYRLNSLDPDSGEYKHSPAVEVWATNAGEANLFTKKFDILNEKTICGGEVAQFTARIVNYGALGGTATSLIVMSDNQDLSDYEQVAALNFSVPGGGGPAGTPVSGSFTMPPHIEGVKYFGMISSIPGVPNADLLGVGQRDKVKLKPDLDFVGATWEILDPDQNEVDSSGRIPIAVSQLVTFTAELQNKGNAHSSDGSLIQVEIKRKGHPYKPVQGALFNIGSIACTAPGGVETVGPFSFPLVSDLADFNDWGKKRLLRLRIVNAGSEWTYNNNKSRKKKIRVKEPVVEFDTVRLLAGGQSATATVLTEDPAADSYTYSWRLTRIPANFPTSLGTLLEASSLPALVATDVPQEGETVHFAAGNYLPAGGRISEGLRLEVDINAAGELFTYGEDIALQPTMDSIPVSYTAFIKCELLAPPAAWFVGYVKGDGHGFGFPSESNRIQRTGTYGFEVLDEVLNDLSPSHTYDSADEGPESSDHCENYCRFTVQQGAVSDCEGYGNGAHNPGQWELTHYSYTLPDGTQEVEVGFDVRLTGALGPGCMPIVVPEFLYGQIDYDILIKFRPDMSPGGLLLGYSVRVEAITDGFPWHQIQIAGLPLIIADPCATGAEVDDVAGDADVPFESTGIGGWIPLY